MDFVWEKIQVDNGEPSEKILIIARNLRYMQEWCSIHGINWRSPMVKFVSSVRGLHGISPEGYFVYLGTDDLELWDRLEQWTSMNVIKPLLTPNI